MLRRRAVIFLISDFLGSGYQSPLARLARRHDLIAIQVTDPRERALPDVGLVTLWDPEGGGWRGGGYRRTPGCASASGAARRRSTRRWSGR